MHYQELLQPVDFSALFQLAFTLYAAFIAIEYAKSFTALVIKRFYNFQGEIKNRIEIIKTLCKNEEMQNIDSDDFFKSGDGLCLVDDYKKKQQVCEKNAVKIEADLIKYVDENTEYRIFRHFSIYMMLFSFTLLLSGGVFRLCPSSVIHFVLSFVLFSALIVLGGWICAVTRATQKWQEKYSIILVCFLYILVITLSFLSLIVRIPWEEVVNETIWMVGMMFAVVLPFVNFLFFFLLVTIQMGKIRNYCENYFQPLIQHCKEAGDLMVKMLHYQEMQNKIDEYKKNDQENGEKPTTGDI